MARTGSVALFLDLPGLYGGLGCPAPFDVRQAFGHVKARYGRMVLAQAYGPFDEGIPEQVQMHLIGQHVTLIHCPGYLNGSGSKKPTVEQMLTKGVYEALYGRRIDTFVIGSGKGDFIPLAGAVRARGRLAVALCVEAACCPYLTEAVDEVVFWPAPAAPQPPAQPAGTQEKPVSPSPSPVPGAVDHTDLRKLAEMDGSGEAMAMDRVLRLLGPNGRLKVEDMLRRGLVKLHNGALELCRNHPLIAVAMNGNGREPRA
ncbi:MAG TPA: NYN domain-containing protein [Candidatus Glassbacteria bacterium]|nr:NYN domain-containing protein [Candidatus Glassbacteria bacterium]